MEKCIEKKYFPVFSFMDTDGNLTSSEYGMGHDEMGDAFDEGIKHHFAHRAGETQGLEIVRRGNDNYFTRKFEWEVVEKFVWVADKEATAKKYIGE